MAEIFLDGVRATSVGAVELLAAHGVADSIAQNPGYRDFGPQLIAPN